MGRNAKRLIAGAGVIGAGAAIVLALGGTSAAGFSPDGADSRSVTVTLPSPAERVRIVEGRSPGRPLVLIDPGHGGRDPGATSVSGAISEKQLTLQLARELRDRLASNGRVRIALTREDDRYLTLDQRSALARRLGATLYVSLHMDSAPNPLARGASVYSLSDVASDAEAAARARSENSAAAQAAGSDGSVRALKGEGRPVNDLESRALVLAGLRSVDLVAPFDEPTPVKLIEAARPDVLIKGADYTEDEVVGGDLVKAWGGIVRLAEIVDGYSTSAAIARMARKGAQS